MSDLILITINDKTGTCVECFAWTTDGNTRKKWGSE
jgi:hypothetical protein